MIRDIDHDFINFEELAKDIETKILKSGDGRTIICITETARKYLCPIWRVWVKKLNDFQINIIVEDIINNSNYKDNYRDLGQYIKDIRDNKIIYEADTKNDLQFCSIFVRKFAEKLGFV